MQNANICHRHVSTRSKAEHNGNIKILFSGFVKFETKQLFTNFVFGLVSLSLRMQTYFRLSLVSPKNRVCELEPRNDFHDIKTFVLILTNKIH